MEESGTDRRDFAVLGSVTTRAPSTRARVPRTLGWSLSLQVVVTA